MYDEKVLAEQLNQAGELITGYLALYVERCFDIDVHPLIMLAVLKFIAEKTIAVNLAEFKDDRHVIEGLEELLREKEKRRPLKLKTIEGRSP